MSKATHAGAAFLSDDEAWNRGRPASRVFRKVMLISRFYNDAIDETARNNGLQAGEFLVLMALMRAGGRDGLRATELYNELLVTSGAITKRVDRLAGLGLIRRVSNTSDRRSSRIQLTATGRAKGEAIRSQASKLNAVADVFGADSLRELDSMLSRYLLAIDEIVSSGDSGGTSP